MIIVLVWEVDCADNEASGEDDGASVGITEVVAPLEEDGDIDEIGVIEGVEGVEGVEATNKEGVDVVVIWVEGAMVGVVVVIWADGATVGDVVVVIVREGAGDLEVTRLVGNCVGNPELPTTTGLPTVFAV